MLSIPMPNNTQVKITEEMGHPPITQILETLQTIKQEILSELMLI
jgi:hypothetical protein